MTKPITGKRIVITRPPHKAAGFAAQLRALGAEPLVLPTITIRAPGDTSRLDAALSALNRYDWVVVTSANGVAHVWQRLEALNLTGHDWPPVAVIGPATGRALEAHGIMPRLMPENHVAEALFDAMQQRVDLRGKRILLPQGNLARSVLADLLHSAGAIVDPVIAYETVPADSSAMPTLPAFDAITFTSSSTVESFCEMVDDPIAAIGSAAVACIGPITAQTAQDQGLPVHAVAEPHTIDGLIAALGILFERTEHS